MEHRIQSWYRSLAAIFQTSHSGSNADYTAKRFRIVLLVIVVALALFFLLQLFSMPLALMLEGYRPQVIQVMESPSDTGYTLIEASSFQGAQALVTLKKGELGFWQVISVNTLP